jgi:hypothetical protein
VADPAFKPSPFEPASIYNAPQLAISQVLQGEATASSLWRTIVAPNKLTPQQRDTVFTDLKRSFGNNPLAGTVIDVATNPWVWLAFLTTPGGPTALKGGGRLFGNAYSAFVGGKSEFTLWLQTAGQAFEGTPLPAIMRSIGNTLRDVKLEEELVVRGARTRLIDAINNKNPGWKIKTLDWRDARRPEAKEFLEKLESTLYANADALDKTFTRTIRTFAPKFYKVTGKTDLEEIVDPEEVAKAFKVWTKTRGRPREYAIRGEKGDVEWRFTAKDPREVGGQLVSRVEEHAALVSEDTLEVLRKMGPEAVAYRDAIEIGKQLRFARTYLREDIAGRYSREIMDRVKDGGRMRGLKEFGVEPTRMERYIDERKLERMWRGMKNNDLIGRAVSGMHQWDDYSGIAMLMSRDMRAALLNGKVTRAEFVGWAKAMASDSINLDHYMPRNTIKMLKVQGGKLVPATEVEIATASKEGGLLSTSGRAQLRESEAVRWEAESLDRMGKHLGTTKAFERAVNESHRATKPGRSWRRDPIDTFIPARTMDYWSAMDRYFTSTARDYALLIAKVPEEVAQLQEQTLPLAKAASEVDKWPRAYWPGAKGKVPFKSVMRYRKNPAEMPPGGWNMSDALVQSHRLLPTQSRGGALASKLLEETFLPTVLGTMHYEYGLTKMAMRTGQDALRSMMDGPFGRFLADTGRTKPLHDALRHFADVDVDRVAGRFLRAGASHLYTTHLGVPNFGSVVLNLTQPFHLAAGRMGTEHVLAAYKDALGEMGGYLTERMALHKLGPISKSERRRLYQKHFEFADEMGVHGHLLEDIEEITFKGMDAAEGTLEYAYRALLKPFEKAELLNRAVTAHAVKRMYVKSGRMPSRDSVGYKHFQRDVEEMVARTQFGAGEMNTPAAFIHRRSLFNNPLARMFLTFPTRTATEAFVLGGRLGTKRYFKGTDVAVPGLGPKGFQIPSWFVGDWLRMLGISSVVQAVGTNVLNSDLRRYGAAAAATDLLRAGVRPAEQMNPVPLPPFASIGWDFMRGMIGGDWPVVWNGVMRTLPGGVGMFKIAQNSPELPLGLKNMQRTYVDWKNPDEQGRVPVFKGSGELVEYRDPMNLILSGLGVSMETHKKGSEIDGYMVQQREVINQRKNEMLRAAAANNYQKMQGIRDQFLHEYGYPLVVTEQQVKSYLRSRTVPRTERILDQMPSFARPDFARLVEAGGLERLGLTPEEFERGFTSNQRRPVAERHQNVSIDIEELKRLQAIVSQAEARGNVRNAGFLPFDGYMAPR